MSEMERHSTADDVTTLSCFPIVSFGRERKGSDTGRSYTFYHLITSLLSQ